MTGAQMEQTTSPGTRRYVTFASREKAVVLFISLGGRSGRSGLGTPCGSDRSGYGVSQGRGEAVGEGQTRRVDRGPAVDFATPLCPSPTLDGYVTGGVSPSLPATAVRCDAAFDGEPAARGVAPPPSRDRCRLRPLPVLFRKRRLTEVGHEHLEQPP